MMMLKVGFYGSLPDLILSYFWVKIFSFWTLVILDYVLQEAEMESLVEKYEKQLADLDWDNVKKKKKALGLRYQSLESQKNKLEGQQEELAKTIEDIRVELDDDKLRDAKENYRKKDVEIELKKIVCEDLNKYYAALEWAITRFHKERMEQVFNNSIFTIREK